MDDGYQMEPGAMKKLSDQKKTGSMGIVGAFPALFLILIISAVVIPGWSNTRQQSSPYEDDQVEALQRMLQTPMSPEMQEILTEKLVALESMNTERVSALERQPEKPLEPCSEKPATESDLVSNPKIGLLEDIQPPFSPMKYTITNIWQDYVDGVLTRVYAGALGEDPEQGVLIVTQQNSLGGGVFFPPVKQGALTILSFDGLRLIIRTQYGDELIFDAAAMRFISSLEEIQPTITPAPTLTPDVEICP